MLNFFSCRNFFSLKFKYLFFRQRFDASSTALNVLHGSDLTSKTVIVTGANSGIGYETARSMAYFGATVILACRDLKKATAAAEKIKSERRNAKLNCIKIDLRCLRSVGDFAKEFCEKYEKLDVLVLNAGIFGADFRLTPEDEIEETLQVNYLSHFYLASLLKEKLSKSLKPKLIVVSAESHRFSPLTAETLDKDTIFSVNKEDFDTIDAYNNSKLMNVLFAIEANLVWRKWGIRSYPVHPGNVVATNLSRNSWFHRWLFAIVRPFAKSAQQAAAPGVFAAFSKELEDQGGTYVNNCFPGTPSLVALNPKARESAWMATEEILKEKLLKAGESVNF